MKIICCHDAYVGRDPGPGKIYHRGDLGLTHHECDDENAKRLLEPILNLEGFVQARQRRGKTPVEIRDDLLARGYDMHASAGIVSAYWSEIIAREMAAEASVGD